MKKTILLFFAGIALFAFIFTTSVLWYNFFYDKKVEDREGVSTLVIHLDDANNTIDENGLIPLDDETARSLQPYEFTVENTSSSSALYDIILEDSIISDDATYSSKELLSRDQLEYQLALNGTVVKTGMLSDLDKNVLDTREISDEQINSYQLWIYVSENAQNTNWQNKYYHFDIKMQVEV